MHVVPELRDTAVDTGNITYIRRVVVQRLFCLRQPIWKGVTNRLQIETVVM